MSRQFDVYANPSRAGRHERPCVVSIQHASLAELRTRVVVPFVMGRALGVHPRLMPGFSIRGQTLYLSPTEIFTVSIRFLRDPIANLEAERDRIIVALDLVFTGI